MSETSQQIVSLIVSKEFNKAKNLITESMNEKLGLLLEEKLMEYAPTLFEAKKTVNSIETDGGEGSVLYSSKLAKKIMQERKAKAKATADAKNKDKTGDGDLDLISKKKCKS
jgi:hypothetical protein